MCPSALLTPVPGAQDGFIRYAILASSFMVAVLIGLKEVKSRCLWLDECSQQQLALHFYEPLFSRLFLPLAAATASTMPLLTYRPKYIYYPFTTYIHTTTRSLMPTRNCSQRLLLDYKCKHGAVHKLYCLKICDFWHPPPPPYTHTHALSSFY